MIVDMWKTCYMWISKLMLWLWFRLLKQAIINLITFTFIRQVPFKSYGLTTGQRYPKLPLLPMIISWNKSQYVRSVIFPFKSMLRKELFKEIDLFQTSSFRCAVFSVTFVNINVTIYLALLNNFIVTDSDKKRLACTTHKHLVTNKYLVFL